MPRESVPSEVVKAKPHGKPPRTLLEKIIAFFRGAR